MILILFSSLFLFGCFVGSFILVIIDRFKTGESFIYGRSHCPYCRHTLAWFDLIPVLSFVSLQGKCRYCHKRLSLYYPLLEICTGLLFAMTYVVLPDKSTLNIVYSLIIVSCLIFVFFCDLKYRLIPFAVVIPLTVLVYVHILFLTPSLFIPTLLCALVAMGFLLVLYFIKSMGFGDVVYVFFMGSLLGYPKIVVGLYIAFILGAIVGLIYIGLKRKRLKGTTIPFGPFLVVGTYITFFFSQPILLFFSHYLPGF